MKCKETVVIFLDFNKAQRRRVKCQERAQKFGSHAIIILVIKSSVSNPKCARMDLQSQTFTAGNRWQNRFAMVRRANGRKTVIVSEMLSQ